MGTDDRSSKFEYQVYDLDDADDLIRLNKKINLNNVHMIESDRMISPSGAIKMIAKFRVDDPQEQSSKTIGELPHGSGRS